VRILATAPSLIDGGAVEIDAATPASGSAGSPTWFSAKGIDGAHSKGDSGGAIFCGGKLAGTVSCSPDRDLRVLDLIKVYGALQPARAFVEEKIHLWAGASADR
jgi:hypothetical protein